MAKKVAMVTGSRAEYGLLYWLLKALEQDDCLDLQLIVTGMHLSPEFGLTWRQIEADGFNIDKKVEMLLSADTAVAISKSIGLGVMGFADALAELQPDIMIVLGDRYEVFAAVVAALNAQIPVAHIHGGELTQAAVDDAFRHAITKMSHLHFTATETYRQRVIQLGEQPDRVFNVGAMGVDNIHKLDLLDKKTLQQQLGVTFKKQNFLITYHPETLGNTDAETQFAALLSVLAEYPEAQLFFSKPNADAGGRVIARMIDDYVAENANHAVVFDSLGSLRYLSLMQAVDVVIGNSSSGLLEAPSLKKAVLNIGDRQRGRVRADNVVDCEASEKAIRESLEYVLGDAFQQQLQQVVSPYGEGGAAQKIISVLKDWPFDKGIKKTFYDLQPKAQNL
jgi:GDP/UDP-N,N'-diacetylbacillosamine 2-epimerase (hydrolysing)